MSTFEKYVLPTIEILVRSSGVSSTMFVLSVSIRIIGQFFIYEYIDIYFVLFEQVHKT